MPMSERRGFRSRCGSSGCCGFALSFALVNAALACHPYDADEDVKIPGDPLGSYAMEGKLVQDTCGAELLNAPDPWRFEVQLSRQNRDLYWLNGREAIVGDITQNGAGFSFDTQVKVELGKNANTAAGCVVYRRDRASGSLDFDGDELEGLAGELSFSYAARAGSECIELLGVPGGVRTLPCELAYSLRGTKRAGTKE